MTQDTNAADHGVSTTKFRHAGPAPAQLPTFRAYVDGPFAQLLALYKENAELKQA